MTDNNCPVCNSSLSEQYVCCPYCGFNQLDKVFINEDEYKSWLKDTVEPCRAVYQRMYGWVDDRLDELKFYQRKADINHKAIVETMDEALRYGKVIYTAICGAIKYKDNPADIMKRTYNLIRMISGYLYSLDSHADAQKNYDQMKKKIDKYEKYHVEEIEQICNSNIPTTYKYRCTQGSDVGKIELTQPMSKEKLALAKANNIVVELITRVDSD